MEKYSYIGYRVKRIDAMDGMLYRKILRSPVAHGIVKKIDISKAQRLPDVVLYL